MEKDEKLQKKKSLLLCVDSGTLNIKHHNGSYCLHSGINLTFNRSFYSNTFYRNDIDTILRILLVPQQNCVKP